ncbi:unnamed protein product [Rotaria magnacalcarata]|uniref:Uncharacterized protein n=4 Tax=Rotaria magnacalcarata TaxID=392030 RepID=A0A816MR98_9BILA|nr:unnamed protein product [Rotaria magnacalcarata]
MGINKFLVLLVAALVSLVSVTSGIACINPSRYSGQTICDPFGRKCGECVSFVKKCTGDERKTSQWRQGRKVRDASISSGTAIATFPDGAYSGHAAIYMGQDHNGIHVWDQWRGHPVSQRIIHCFVSVTNGISCSNPGGYEGRKICDQFGGQCGQCVSFVKVCTGDRRATWQWGQGAKVRNANIAYGTGIATFPNGQYSGHAAIYVGQNDQGIQVWDQWRGHLVSSRTIYWNGNGLSNNGDSFYVIK